MNWRVYLAETFRSNPRHFERICGHEPPILMKGQNKFAFKRSLRLVPDTLIVGCVFLRREKIAFVLKTNDGLVSNGQI